MDTHGSIDEGRSGVTPENQHYRFYPAKSGQSDRFCACNVRQSEIRGYVPSLGGGSIQFHLKSRVLCAESDDEFGIIDEF